MKYLILCDVDGTLLNNRGVISERSIEYIKQLSKNHYFCLVTSSSYQRVLPLYTQLNLNTHIACKNGGLIINPNTNERFVYAMKNTEILKYFNDLKHITTSVFYKCEGDAYLYNFDDKCRVVMNIPENIKLNHGDYNDLKLSNSTNLYLIVNASDSTELENYFSNLDLRVDCMGKDRKIAIYVITHKLALKEKAVDFFKTNYTYDKMIAFGDSEADLEMLNRSDISFLMKNTSVKNSNILVTEFSNNEDGVSIELEKIIKRG